MSGSQNSSRAVQQNLQVAPPVPILDLSRDYILSVIGDNATQPLNSSVNVTSFTGRSSSMVTSDLDTSPARHNPLVKRDAEPCAADRPCPDKRLHFPITQSIPTLTDSSSCCSTAGKCGYGPDYCGSSNCISNCDATAMCGKYSEGGSLKCGMNLCCSHYGSCNLL